MEPWRIFLGYTPLLLLGDKWCGVCYVDSWGGSVILFGAYEL